MISINVQYFRGIDHAEIQCSPLALCSGENGSGKSSISQAVAAALTGDALPNHFQLKKAGAAQLVRRGGKSARVIVQSAVGEARMTWPECQLSTSGDAPHASIYAAGLASIPEMERPKDRAAALEPYLKATPTKDDLTRAMERFKPEAIDRLWAEIQAKGWDDTHVAYEVARRDAGRDWQKTTGENFGSDKAANWKPADVEENTMAFSIEDIEGKIAKARAALESALSQSAVADSELAVLRERAANVEEYGKTLTAAEQALTGWREEAEAAATTFNNLPDFAGAGSGIPCPHCGEPLTLKRDGPKTTLEKFEKIPEAELKSRRLARADAEGSLSRTAHALQQAEQRMGEVTAALRLAEEAREKLASIGERQEGTPGLVERAREDLVARENDLRLMQQWLNAKALYGQWMSANLKVAILSPGGIRAKKLGETVAGFNDGVLAPLCESAKIGRVNLTEDLTVRLGELPYPLLSAGEQWRVRLILQAAMARMDGSSMMIVDGLPDTDNAGRNSLFRLMQFLKNDVGLPVLICMAEIKGAPVPDLARGDLGNTYIIAGAKALPLAEAQARAA